MVEGVRYVLKIWNAHVPIIGALAERELKFQCMYLKGGLPNMGIQFRASQISLAYA